MWGNLGMALASMALGSCIGLSHKNGGNKSEAKQAFIILLLRAPFIFLFSYITID